MDKILRDSKNDHETSRIPREFRTPQRPGWEAGPEGELAAVEHGEDASVRSEENKRQVGTGATMVRPESLDSKSEVIKFSEEPKRQIDQKLLERLLNGEKIEGLNISIDDSKSVNEITESLMGSSENQN